MASGVYQITNTVNGKTYVGSARNIAIRRRNHRRDLRKNKHGNKYLQRSWNKYGAESFRFSTLLICSPEDLRFFEQRCIDKLNPDYNLMRVGEVGWIHAEETKEKQRERTKAQWQSPENLEKRRKAAERRALLDEAEKIIRDFEQEMWPTKSRERVIEHRGLALTYSGWAERLGISKSQVEKRLQKYSGNLDVALKFVELPGVVARTYTAHGETRTLREWAAALGESYTTLFNRIHKRGVAVEDALVSGRIRRYVGRDGLKQEEARMRSKLIAFNGESLTYAEWAARLGVSKCTLVNRIHSLGWSVEQALTTPLVEGNGRKAKTYPFRGEHISAIEAAERFGGSVKTIQKRLNAGESMEDIAAGRKRRRFAYQGEEKTSDEWASVLCVTPTHVVNMTKKYGTEEGLKRLHENARARGVYYETNGENDARHPNHP